MNPACARCRAAIAEFPGLDRAKQHAMTDHAAGCPACARHLDDARRVVAYMRGLNPVLPSAGLMPRLLAAPRQVPPPTAALGRFALLIAVLAVVGVAVMRDQIALPDQAQAVRPPATEAAAALPVPVERRGAVGLTTRVAPTPGPAGAPAPDAVAAEPSRPGRGRLAAAPQDQGNDVAPLPAVPPTEPPGAPPTRRNRPAPSPTPEPPPLVCGSIVVRVFTDVAGTGGVPCAGCDGRLSAEDLVVAQALGLTLPGFQLAVHRGEGTPGPPLFERTIQEVGQVASHTFEFECDQTGPMLLEIAGDLGPWQPCSAAVQGPVTMPGQYAIDIGLTTVCALPTATATAANAIEPGTPTSPIGATPTAVGALPPDDLPPDQAVGLP